MIIKWIGAFLVLSGCGGFGFAMAAAHRREEQALGQLIRALDFMHCELSYRMTPLPQLCKSTANAVSGPVGHVFARLATELEQQVSPDAGCCMAAALTAVPVSPGLHEIFSDLGTTLGCFDLPGQLRGIDAARKHSETSLRQLSENRTNRLRSYQTLGLCAGAALAILFL